MITDQLSARSLPGKVDGKENDEEGVEDPRAVGLLQARDHLMLASTCQHVAHFTEVQQPVQ